MASNNEAWKVWAKGISHGLQVGITNIPNSLLTHYRRLKLSDSEALLLIHLLSFQQVDHKDFPSMEEIEQRMDAAPGVISSSVRKLMKDGWLSIDEHTDGVTGVQYERYNLSGMYNKLAVCMAEQFAASQKQTQSERRANNQNNREDQERNLFVIFEKEFARPLSPMECETISGWVDQDRYAEELILLALKEAVFAGKVHFRYIDRILLEWSRNRVKTIEDAKAYTQRFRNQGR